MHSVSQALTVRIKWQFLQSAQPSSFVASAVSSSSELAQANTLPEDVTSWSSCLLGCKANRLLMPSVWLVCEGVCQVAGVWQEAEGQDMSDSMGTRWS